jgi:hypothetical protein
MATLRRKPDAPPLILSADAQAIVSSMRGLPDAERLALMKYLGVERPWQLGYVTYHVSIPELGIKVLKSQVNDNRVLLERYGQLAREADDMEEALAKYLAGPKLVALRHQQRHRLAWESLSKCPLTALDWKSAYDHVLEQGGADLLPGRKKERMSLAQFKRDYLDSHPELKQKIAEAKAAQRRRDATL